MLTRSELLRIARARLLDAKVLFEGRRYDGAVYVCGYALEIYLKARICKTLRWAGFPETRNEFDQLQSFKAHDLEILLRLAGRERIKTRHIADWSIVEKWRPESRYNRLGSANKIDAKNMIDATERLMRVL